MDQRSSLDRYFNANRLTAIPRRRAPRLALLDLVAGEFEPGHRFSESEVNAILTRYHPDFCSLRRYLVEEGFMERRSGMYWRSGGTFDVTDDD